MNTISRTAAVSVAVITFLGLPMQSFAQGAYGSAIYEYGIYDRYGLYEYGPYADGYEAYGGFDGEPGEDDWYYDYYDLGYGYDDRYLDYYLDSFDAAALERHDDLDDLDDFEDLDDIRDRVDSVDTLDDDLEHRLEELNEADEFDELDVDESDIPYSDDGLIENYGFD